MRPISYFLTISLPITVATELQLEASSERSIPKAWRHRVGQPVLPQQPTPLHPPHESIRPHHSEPPQQHVRPHHSEPPQQHVRPHHPVRPHQSVLPHHIVPSHKPFSLYLFTDKDDCISSSLPAYRTSYSTGFNTDDPGPETIAVESTSVTEDSAGTGTSVMIETTSTTMAFDATSISSSSSSSIPIDMQTANPINFILSLPSSPLPRLSTVLSASIGIESAGTDKSVVIETTSTTMAFDATSISSSSSSSIPIDMQTANPINFILSLPSSPLPRLSTVLSASSGIESTLIRSLTSSQASSDSSLLLPRSSASGGVSSIPGSTLDFTPFIARISSDEFGSAHTITLKITSLPGEFASAINSILAISHVSDSTVVLSQALVSVSSPLATTMSPGSSVSQSSSSSMLKSSSIVSSTLSSSVSSPISSDVPISSSGSPSISFDVLISVSIPSSDSSDIPAFSSIPLPDSSDVPAFSSTPLSSEESSLSIALPTTFSSITAPICAASGSKQLFYR
ncbi:hypothetical protein DE146DRAFT_637862 [Phaeosphaeria sp. MPI-PUGE-AT-0046c]|nr:hypothetical protein DE146DRAFT_637862 [Phaeosphaeria sp. MPI-PUGE-AT-0046c]